MLGKLTKMVDVIRRLASSGLIWHEIRDGAEQQTDRGEREAREGGYDGSRLRYYSCTAGSPATGQNTALVPPRIG